MSNIPVYPIDFISDKNEISQSIIEDLEILSFKDGNGCLADEVFNTRTDAQKVARNHLATTYTWNKQFISDTQKLLNDRAFEEEYPLDASNAYSSWCDIQQEDGFVEKYQYIDWKWASHLNAIPQIMQASSLYHLTAPVISLMVPILMLFVPFVILRIKGTSINLTEYTEALKGVFKTHMIGKLFTEFGDGGWDKKIYLLVSVFFYLAQIYQNIAMCIRFYRNIQHIHSMFDNLEKHMLINISQLHKLKNRCSDLSSYSEFADSLQSQITNETEILQILQSLPTFRPTPGGISRIGKCMSTFYRLRFDAEYNDTINRSFALTSYIHIMHSIQNRIADKTMSIPKIAKKTVLEKAIFPALINETQNEVVSNNINLQNNLLITGPNASGKTTLLKNMLSNNILVQQVGAGAFQKGLVRPYEFFHCYINIPDTSGRDSLFQAEARRCKDILDVISSNSKSTHLCIFDELYSGTNPHEAISCGTAFLHYLSKNNMVNFMLTTHFSHVCANLKRVKKIKNMQMEVIEVYDPKVNASEPIDFKYTFKCKKGISRVRGGIKVLRDLSYPNNIISNATNIIRSISI